MLDNNWNKWNSNDDRRMVKLRELQLTMMNWNWLIWWLGGGEYMHDRVIAKFYDGPNSYKLMT